MPTNLDAMREMSAGVRAMMFACYVKACAPPPVGDGGSAGGHARRLAEQAIAQIKAAEGGRAGGPITKAMKSIAAAHGSKMLGLKYRIKGAKRTTAKVYERARQSLVPGARRKGDTKNTKAAEEKYVKEGLSDVLRFTMEVPEKGHVTHVKESLKDLQKQGYKVLEVDNRWKSAKDLTPDDAYQGINCTVQAPDGTRFELQFHTKTSFHTKDKLMHKDYEIVRGDTDATRAERAAAAERMVDTASQIPIPDGIVGAKLL